MHQHIDWILVWYKIIVRSQLHVFHIHSSNQNSICSDGGWRFNPSVWCSPISPIFVWQVFILVTDHYPLCKVIESKGSIATMVAARMQRWVLTLSAYQYTIEHDKGAPNQCAKCMSTLPMTWWYRDSAEKIHLMYKPITWQWLRHKLQQKQ